MQFRYKDYRHDNQQKIMTVSADEFIRRFLLHVLPNGFQELQRRCAFLRYLALLRKAEWVVYAKPPFAGARQVLDYVGRYTHRVAISNHRLLAIEDPSVFS